MNAPFPDVLRTTGRAAAPVSARTLRPLAEDDLALLGEEKGVQAPPLKRLSERHHALARALASGMSAGNAAITCGYDPSRVSILQADPAFKELLAFYREDTDRAYRDMHERLAGISADAVEELAERLEHDSTLEVTERKIGVGTLIEITKLGADRTGYGPQSSSTNLNVNVDLAAKLEAARRRVAERKDV